MLIILIISFIIAFIGACINLVYKAIKPPEEEIQPDIPYYIEEQIQALYNQIAVNHALIDDYEEKLHYTKNIDKRLLYEKKKSDLLYKVARLEEKVYKLLEKYEE
jgi:hypothetical protein